MNDTPIPARLRVLLEAERARADAPDDAKEAARAKLAARLGPGAGLDGADPHDGGGTDDGAGSATPAAPAAPSNGALAQAPSGLAMKLASALLVGGLVGGGVVATVAKPAERIVYVTAPATPASTAAAESASGAPRPTASATGAAESAPGTTVPNLPVTALPDVTPARPPAQAAAASAPVAASADGGRDTDLSAERALVERARSALARGDAAGALAAVERHEREFSRGQLVEEREVLAVQALAASGRAQEAAERGARFRKAYPTSLLLPLVDAALR